MHQVCRLDYQVLYSVVCGSLKGLLNVVDLLAVTRVDVVDDDLSCECSSDRPVRICFLKGFLDSADIFSAAVIEGCSEAYNEELVFAYVILIKRIILGCIACISSEVVRACFFTFNLCLLLVCQRIPGCLCGLALSISLICVVLNIDGIDQSCAFCNRICSSLFFRSRFLSIASAACQKRE